MEKYKQHLSRLIRKEMGLGSGTEAELFSLLHFQPSPGKVVRYLTCLSRFRILWTFPAGEQVTILESICAELSPDVRSDLFIQVITIVFRQASPGEDRTAGVRHFIGFTKMCLENERDVRVKAGLALVMLLTLKKHPLLSTGVDLQAATLSLLFVSDTISSAAVFNSLMELYGAHRVIPLVIDLLTEHPHKTNLFLTNTLVEQAIQLSRQQKINVFEKLKLFLMQQKKMVPEEKLTRLLSRFITAMGRNFCLTNTVFPSRNTEKGAGRTSRGKLVVNRRFSLLQQTKGG